MESAFQIEEVTKEKSGIERLTLTDFRNYAFLRFEPHFGPIVITGVNGSGKTNILEAISFLTPGRGLRSAKLSDIKRITPAPVSEGYKPADSGISWAVNACVRKNGEKYELATAAQKNIQDTEDESRIFARRIVQIDKEKVSTQSELGKYLSAIWVTPSMDRIFTGGPQPRRSFLDRIVYTFDLEHAKRTAVFEHLYKEWYRLLKSGKADPIWLLGLEDQMAQVGVAIAAARREVVARLNTFITQDPDDVFPDLMLGLNGKIEKLLDTMPAIDVEDHYRDILKQSRSSVFQNESVEGINHTDFEVYYKKKHMPAHLCSTGEQKSLLVSIILAQTKCQILDKGFSPVLLLDEVTTHLDDQKRDALLSKICDLNLQAFITSTEPQIFHSIQSKTQFFELKDGQIKEK